MSLLKIYIACHKPCDVPSDKVYSPIQVGRSKSQYSLDMIGDDTGDNISDKNSTYCELTAKYRALADSEPNVIFGGCLAEYKYYDMAPLIERGISLTI